MPITINPAADDLKAIEGVKDPAIRERIVIERAIIRTAATQLIAAGFFLRVSYGGEDGYGCERTQDVETVMKAVHACDEEWLMVVRPAAESKTGYRLVGTVYLVYGNDGWDVIADNSVVLEDHLTTASALADTIADQGATVTL